MALLFTSLIIITCVLLVLIIMVQNPKGGGLGSSFGGSGTQVFGGVKKTTDFLDRGTWGLAIVLVALVLLANVTLTPNTGGPEQPESELTEGVDIEQQAPQQQPIGQPGQQGGGQGLQRGTQSGGGQQRGGSPQSGGGQQGRQQMQQQQSSQGSQQEGMQMPENVEGN